ncbi:MAG: hypothetical protein C6Y22_20225 [Hapalosiphonaceae cyanobacterium JJU2]|nr:MAG: hypothetical protein C6Y22_20225 [Hapalosiphonaceae cyanobacterium JJU2]TBR57058.1 hypothetical protein B4U84_26910 [Westiellopsis prolifica IICB1]
MTMGYTDFNQLQVVRPRANGCEECLASGDTWVHLRVCLICGHVGCCDSSKNKHATKHFHCTGHPLIKSFEPGENWAWSYTDKTFVHLPATNKADT